MGAALARAAYAALLRLLLPACFVRLWWRGRDEPAYRRHWAERLGAGPPVAPGALWLHAVSLGETRAAAALIEALRRRRPGLRLLLTHGTATGREAGAALLRAGDAQCWLPFDTPGAVRRFLRRTRPALGVLMETEVWPMLLHEAGRAGVPMLLANARLSVRSAAKGRRLDSLLRPAVAGFAEVLAQTADDAARLRAAGATTVRVSGNLKFDMAPDMAQLARGRRWRAALARPVVLAASTREGEEAALIEVWRTLPAPRPLLVIVPRHPQRFDAVAQLAQARLGAIARRSRWPPAAVLDAAHDAAADRPPADALRAEAWVGDSIGEMALYYGLADVALLGGSFGRFGGQNLIEAAACGCPLVMGPHTFNFAEAAELALAAGAAERVPDLDAGVALAATIAADGSHTQRAARAEAFAGAHRGAAMRCADAVLARLPDAGARGGG